MNFALRGCLAVCTWALIVFPGWLRADDDAEESETAPGVLAHYETSPAAGGPAVVVERIEPVPRLFATAAAPGTTRVAWSGLLTIPFRSEYVFTAQHSTLDELKITLAGQAVSLGEPIELAPGLCPLAISALERSGTPAFQLWWRSGHFADEPIEARHFRHEPARVAKTGAPRSALADRGAVLAQTHGCFRCHAGPESLITGLAGGLPPEAELPGPRLDQLGERVESSWVFAWLLDPSAVDAQTRMPRLLANTPADRLTARILTTYLCRPANGAPAAPSQAPQAEHGKALYAAAGCAACHEPPENDPTDPSLVSPAPRLANLGRKWKPAGLAAFLRDPLTTRPHGRMPTFGLSAVDAAGIAAYLVERDGPDNRPANAPVPTPTNDELAQAWRKLAGASAPLPAPDQLLAQVAARTMAARGCFDCHDHATGDALSVMRSASGRARITVKQVSLPAPVSAPDLRALAPARLQSGCLGQGAGRGQAPQFALAASDRQALAAYLATLSPTSTASSMDRLRLDLAALNCLRCHSNEGQGGQSLAAHSGPESTALHALTPMLTGAGERVDGKVLRAWLSGGAGADALRPWVGARMPGFGQRASRVADDLAARDGVSAAGLLTGAAAPSVSAPHSDPQLLATGQMLVGTKALACVNCHPLHGKTLSGQPDPTSRGPELDKLAAHLRGEYFARWMRDPARIRPGTKMPQTIRPDGTVPIRSLESLSGGAPLDALWTYLSRGAEAPAPVEDTAVMVEPTLFGPVVQRGEVLGIPRGVALGFADGTLLFDADTLQLAALWFGGFIKSSPGSYFGVNWSTQGSQPLRLELAAQPLSFQLAGGAWSSFALPLDSDPNRGTRFEGYQVGRSAVRLRYRLLVGETTVTVTDELRLEAGAKWQGFARRLHFAGLPAGARAALALEPAETLQRFSADGQSADDELTLARAPLAALNSGDRRRIVRATSAAGAAWDLADSKAPRIVSGPAPASGPLEIGVDWWMPTGGTQENIAAALARLAGTAPVMDDDFDAPRRPAAPLAPVPVVQTAPEPEQPKPTRAAVNHKENVDEFAPVNARFLRFKITKSEQDASPGIDELEVYGADPAVNLGPQGKATASSVIPGYPIHQIAHLNDGKLGNNNSWISNESNGGWAQIEWPRPVELRKVIWARDRTGVCRDRLAVHYQVLVSDDGAQWTKVADDADRVATAAGATIVADASPGYRLELIPLPFDGCRPSDIEFGPDGAMYAIAMSEGQVYRTPRPPVDQPLAVRWERFASGLYHPIGLAIVDGRIFVATKPEITELIDRDGDGRADEYRTVASGWGLSRGWHEYTFGLAVDRQKNLWFALNTGYFWTNPGYVNPGRWRGSVMKASFEADRLEVVAKGCRVPNGIARGPNGDIFYTDNQGDWIQSCKLAHVVPGRFYGHPEYKEDALPAGQYPDGRSSVWMPYERSRSTGGPVCDETGGKFGPFADQLFLGDVGYGANPGIMRVALEKVDGEYQGACFRFVDNQPHGCVRMKFGPDQQLYIAALTTGLARLKWQGTTPLAIREVKIRPGGKGFVLHFTRPLAADTQVNSAQLRIRRYHYLYTGNYGSPDADVTVVPATGVELAPDRQSLVLSLPVETYPIGMVYEINAGKLSADDGETLVHNEAWYTVHRIPQ